MSIINQTLRELDARKVGPTSPKASQRPVETVRRGAVRWAFAGTFLFAAGLAALFLFGGGKTVPTKEVETLRPVQVAPVAAPDPFPRIEVAFDAMDGQVVKDTQSAHPVVARQLEPVSLHAQTEKPLPPKMAVEPSLASLKMGQPNAIAQPSIVRVESSKQTAGEEADERYRKALMFIQKGRENLARPLLEEALRLSPPHVAARQTLVALLSEAGENREAEAVLRGGRAAVPDNAWFALSLARLQEARGDVQGAADTLQNGLGARDLNGEYHATLAALLVRLKQYPQAERQYERSLKLQPEQGVWWMGLGMSLAAQEKIADARAAYTRALAAGNLPDSLIGFVRAKLVAQAPAAPVEY